MLDRRAFLLSALALAATAACGTDRPAPSTATGVAASGRVFPRTVRHEQGETVLDAAPQRVVCGTDGGELCSLLALGIKPVGFGQRNDPLRPWLAGLADGIDSYDLSGSETSYERLVAWEPDLILVQNGFATPETMPRFTQIAPTVATSFDDWRANLRQVGQAVGRDAEAAALEAEKDAAVEAVRSSLAGRGAGMRVRALTAFPDGSTYVLNDSSPIGKVAAALGLAPLPAATESGEAVNLISNEQLDVVDGDLLLVLHFGDRAGMDVLRTQAVFTSLDVVKAGKVVDLSEDESNALYFDSVLTVEPNARTLQRLVTAAA